MTRGVLSYRKFNLRTGLLSTSKTYSPDLCSPYSRPLKSRGCPCYRSGPLWSVNVFNKGVIRTEIRFSEIQDGKDVDVLRGPFHKLKKFSVISQMMYWSKYSGNRSSFYGPTYRLFFLEFHWFCQQLFDHTQFSSLFYIWVFQLFHHKIFQKRIDSIERFDESNTL